NPSSRSCRPRYSRVSDSGSATRTALGMPATLARTRAPRQMSFVAYLRQPFLSRRIDPWPLQPSVPEDSPDEPEAEDARDQQAEERDEVNPEGVRPALREDADHGGAEQSPKDHERDRDPVCRFVDVVVDLVDAGVLDVHLEGSLAQLLEHIRDLVRHVPR